MFGLLLFFDHLFQLWAVIYTGCDFICKQLIQNLQTILLIHISAVLHKQGAEESQKLSFVWLEPQEIKIRHFWKYRYLMLVWGGGGGMVFFNRLLSSLSKTGSLTKNT
jgi:hypothetical protein